MPRLDVEQPAVASPRQGFFEGPMIDRVLAQLPEHYADVVRFVAFSGWRRSEIEGLLWSEIDEAGGVIRLPPERSKNRDGRVLPIVGPMKEVLQRRAAYREHSPLVFTRYVERRKAYVPVGYWRKAWAKATKAAGCPGAIMHDFRRTAVRNLIRARVPERVAMQFTGHKTRAIFDRYTIIRESDLQEAGEQMAQHPAGNGQGN